MPVQTTYTAEHERGFEGQIEDTQVYNVYSKVAEGSDIPFGRAVVRGTGDEQAVLPSTTGEDLLGVTVTTTAWTTQLDGSRVYEEFREMNICNFGMLYVYTETAVVPGDPVYFRHTAEAAPLDVVGRFRNDDSGTNADLIANCTFESTTGAGEIARIRIGYGS